MNDLTHPPVRRSVADIAVELGVHRGTVATQLSRAYEKLDLPDLMDFIE